MPEDAESYIPMINEGGYDRTVSGPVLFELPDRPGEFLGSLKYAYSKTTQAYYINIYAVPALGNYGDGISTGGWTFIPEVEVPQGAKEVLGQGSSWWD